VRREFRTDLVENRTLALCDFDADGQVDAAIQALAEDRPHRLEQRRREHGCADDRNIGGSLVRIDGDGHVLKKVMVTARQ